MIHPMQPLGSLRLTWIAMVVLGIGVIGYYQRSEASVYWLVLPLSLLAINLICAILVNPRFRRHGPLLAFHLCLLLLIVLVAYGQLTRFKGRIEIAEGQAFDPNMVIVDQSGPWHRSRLQNIDFIQGPIQINYAAGLIRLDTASQIVAGRDAGVQTAIGDDSPLDVGGYRFYTTFNKGFAVAMTWTSTDDEAIIGLVHFPSYPGLHWKQVNHWTTPEGVELKLTFDPGSPPNNASPWTFTSAIASPLLTIEPGQQTVIPGQEIELNKTKLKFESVHLWMGYRIYYDPTLPWLFTTTLLGILFLAWHFRLKLWPRATAEQKPTAGYFQPSGGVRVHSP